MPLVQLAQAVIGAVIAAAPTLAPTLPPAPQLVDFATLVEHPDRFLDGPVRAYVQFHSDLETWDGGLTRFVPSRFAGFRAWSDAQLPWVEEDYRDPTGVLFLRLDSTELGDLQEARMHDRLLVTCEVRALFGGMAWIEVTRILPSRRSISEGSVLHAIRAAELAERQSWTLAVSELERALAAPLPEHAARVLDAALGHCRARCAAVEAGVRLGHTEAGEASARVRDTLRGGR